MTEHEFSYFKENELKGTEEPSEEFMNYIHGCIKIESLI